MKAGWSCIKSLLPCGLNVQSTIHYLRGSPYQNTFPSRKPSHFNESKSKKVASQTPDLIFLRPSPAQINHGIVSLDQKTLHNKHIYFWSHTRGVEAIPTQSCQRSALLSPPWNQVRKPAVYGSSGSQRYGSLRAQTAWNRRQFLDVS